MRTPQTGLIIAAVAAVLIVAGSVAIAVLVPERGAVPGVAVAGPNPPTTRSSTTSCVYNRATDRPVGKDVGLPDNASKTPDTGTVVLTLKTDQGDIPLTLDRAKAPCAVQNLLFLASKKYYDGTPCHRLSVMAGLKVLQCGDPTGSGRGGPGYEFADELPTDLKPAPAVQGTVVYPKGTVAMANAGPNTNGSQFFLVYADTPIAPNYPVMGSYTGAAQATIDKIVAGGVTGEEFQPGDGRPKIPVTIQQAVAGG